MREIRSLPGMAEELAVRRLVQKVSLSGAAGSACSPGSADSAVEHNADSGHTLLSRLEHHGVHGRLARITDEDLPQLDVPTLLQLKDGRWLLVTVIRRGRVVVEDSLRREHTFTLREVSHEFAGLVFDRTPELPRGHTVLSRVLRVIWQHRGVLYPAAALAVLAQVLSLLSPQFTRILIDDAVPQGSTNLLYGVVAGMILIAVLRASAGWLEQRILQLVQIRLDASLERGLLGHVLRLPYRFLEGKSVGQLIQGFQGLTQARTALTVEALGVAIGGCTALILLVLMYPMMPGPTLLVASVGIGSAIVAIAIGHHQEKLQERIVGASVRERESVLEILARVSTLKAAGAADRAVDQWLGLLRHARVLVRQSERLTLGCHVAIDLLGQLQLQMLWIWGGLRVIGGSLRLGELIAFTLMATLFHASSGRVAKALVKLRALKPQLGETESLLEQKPDVPAGRRARRCSSGAPIEIRDLWFRYAEDRPWVFSGFNLTVRPGEMHHLSGPSGFGKTTLLKLAAGLYEPTRGHILIGGRPPREAREDMIFVPQHVRIFNASVRDNLSLLSGGAPFARLMRTAELTGLADLVQTWPMGYETLLAHGGGNFSGGQRQLIVLTAALASDKPLLLLDEATANLDASSIRRLAGSSLFAGRTVLHAGHDSNLQVAYGAVCRVQAESHGTAHSDGRPAPAGGVGPCGRTVRL